MAWWWWVLLWVVLLAGSVGVFALLGLSLWRKAGLLLRELGAASDRFSAVSAGMQQLAEQSAEPAVFTSASTLRQQRFLAGRVQSARQSVR